MALTSVTRSDYQISASLERFGVDLEHLACPNNCVAVMRPKKVEIAKLERTLDRIPITPFELRQLLRREEQRDEGQAVRTEKLPFQPARRTSHESQFWSMVREIKQRSKKRVSPIEHQTRPRTPTAG